MEKDKSTNWHLAPFKFSQYKAILIFPCWYDTNLPERWKNDKSRNWHL